MLKVQRRRHLKVFAKPENNNNNEKAVLTIRALDAPSCRRRGRRAAPAATPSPTFHPPACPGRHPERPTTQLHKDLAQVQSSVWCK